MTCYSPRTAYRARFPSTGVLFDGRHRDAGEQIKLPCGGCVGCREARMKSWGLRIAHEASQHKHSIFITLTYDNDHLPEDQSVSPREMQLFMKRLRKRIGCKVRFYLCGEYGAKLGRPHYHIILFGYRFPDAVHYKTSASGHYLFMSKTLIEIWGKGHADFGSVTPQSGSYVAGYCMKKVNGPQSDEHYMRLDSEGRPFKLRPEFALMSNRPGIGAAWLDKYEGDVFPDDFIVSNGRKFAVPRYYDNRIKQRNPAIVEEAKQQREENANTPDNQFHNTPARLEVRQGIKERRLERLVRQYERDEQ